MNSISVALLKHTINIKRALFRGYNFGVQIVDAENWRILLPSFKETVGLFIVLPRCKACIMIIFTFCIKVLKYNQLSHLCHLFNKMFSLIADKKWTIFNMLSLISV